MKTIDRFPGWLAGLGVAMALAAPALAAPVRPIRFDRLSLEQGLSQSSVMDILQDSRGYVWLATEEGLDRYDGLAFKVYKHDPADPASLPSSFVWDVEEDPSGDLWVATTSGLGLLQRATDSVVRQEKLAGVSIRTLRVPGEGPRPLDRHARRGPPPARRVERHRHALHPRPVPGLEPRRRPHLRPVPRRQGSALGGNRRGARPVGRRGLRALPGRSVGPEGPERRPGARRRRGRRGRPLGGHVGRRPEPPGPRDRSLRTVPQRSEGRLEPRPRPGARAPAGRGRAAVGGHQRGPRSAGPERPRVRALPTGPDEPGQPGRQPRPVAGSGPGWRPVGRDPPRRCPQVEPAELAARPRGPRPGQPRGPGERPRHVLLRGPGRAALDRHLRCRPLRDGPHDGRDDRLP